MPDRSGSSGSNAAPSHARSARHGGAAHRRARASAGASVAPQHELAPQPLRAAEASEGLAVRRLRVPAADVVFVKGVVEASEGLGVVFADAGGELTIAAPLGREAELTRLLDDLCREVSHDTELAAHA